MWRQIWYSKHLKQIQQINFASNLIFWVGMGWVLGNLLRGHLREHPQRAFIETWNMWDTDCIYDIENNDLNIHSDPCNYYLTGWWNNPTNFCDKKWSAAWEFTWLTDYRAICHLQGRCYKEVSSRRRQGCRQALWQIQTRDMRQLDPKSTQPKPSTRAIQITFLVCQWKSLKKVGEKWKILVNS